LDEVRISSVIRQISGIPTAPFEADADTIGLWHFDSYDPERGFPDASRFQNWANVVSSVKPESKP